MGIESIVMKFKRLSYREENILDVHANGSPVPSIKVICVSRTFLHGAARLLGAGERIQANNGSSTNTRTNSGEMQTGSGRDGGQDRVQSAQVGGMMTPQQQQHGRMVGQIVTPHQFGGQGRTQNAQLGSQPSMAGMMTPQQQHYGTMVAQIVTPHQFGLTPFQSTHNNHTSCTMLSLLFCRSYDSIYMFSWHSYYYACSTDNCKTISRILCMHYTLY